MSCHRSAQHLAVLIAVALAGAAGAALAEDASGRQVYVEHCASCHGANLEGQPNWKQRLPTGRLPAPPHDATGHTWHHSDRQLFRIVSSGTELISRSAPSARRVERVPDRVSDQGEGRASKGDA